MYSLFKKEISSFLQSLIGIIVITVFLLINGLVIWVFPSDFNILESGYSNLDGLFLLAPFVFLFLIPAITMKSFSEEKKSGTIELLLTKPLSDIQIILGKYFASLCLVIFSLLPTLIYFITVYKLGNPEGNIDMGATWGSYIGLLLLGATFTAIGLFSSSITDNQIIAFIVSLTLCAFMYLGFEFIYLLPIFSKVDLFIRSIGISYHYSSISRGVVDTRDLLYFFSIIVLFLLFIKTTLQSRKW